MKESPISIRGVWSVWQRHALVYLKTWLVNCLPPLTEPRIYLFSFGLGLSPIIRDLHYHGQPVSYLQFIAPGMIALGLSFQSFFEGAYGTYIRIRYQRTWQAMLTAPLTFNDVFFGDWLWAATKGVIAGVLTGLVAYFWGVFPGTMLIASLPAIILGSLLFGAMGILTAGTVKTVDQINVPVFLVMIPMTMLAGIYFPRENLPAKISLLSSFSPLSPLVDLLRTHLAQTLNSPLLFLQLLGWTVLFAILARREIYKKIFG